MPYKDGDHRHKEIGGHHRALSRYYMIKHRVEHPEEPGNSGYAGVELRMTPEDFVAWFQPRDFSGCSVDRIDSDGHYELSNIRIIPALENIKRSKAVDGRVVCYRCGQEKPIEAMVKESRRRSGYSTCCRSCEADRTRRTRERSRQPLARAA